MVVLCDTCSILMLIRIAPNMFIDPLYESITLPCVAIEFRRTQKFQTKYPWRSQSSANVVPIPTSETESADHQLMLKVIKQSLSSGVINAQNERLFDLSRTDQEVVSFAVAKKYAMSTGDQGIVDFAMQEFAGDFIGNISPLEIIVIWLKKGLFQWDDQRHSILQEWTLTKENPQPLQAKRDFYNITGRQYPGP